MSHTIGFKHFDWLYGYPGQGLADLLQLVDEQGWRVAICQDEEDTEGPYSIIFWTWTEE